MWSSTLVLSRPRYVPPCAVDCTALAALCLLHLRQQRRWCWSIPRNPSDSRPEWSRTSKPTTTCRTWRSLHVVRLSHVLRVFPTPSHLVDRCNNERRASSDCIYAHHSPLSRTDATVQGLRGVLRTLSPLSPPCLPSHCPPTHRWVWLASLWMEASPLPGPQAHSSQGYLP